jgi:hypothetical protein
MFDHLFMPSDDLLKMQQAAQQMAAMQAHMNAAQGLWAANERARTKDGQPSDVIDLVPTADGVYAVPAALEHRARAI